MKKNPFYLPLKTIFTFVGIYVALYMIKDIVVIAPEVQVIITKIFKIAMILFVAKSFDDGLDAENRVFTKIRTKRNKDIDMATMKVVFRTIKVIIYIIAGFMVISELGYNISGFMTGLGIGGVVITLARQDTAKSLIGGISIFLDKPFKVGDYIEVDKYQGTVEEIKFRTTNIRTLENSVLHIPNSEMSISAIINYSEMEKRRYYTKLVLELDTPLEKVESVKNKIEAMLRKREDVIQDTTISVRFREISDNGFEIVIMAYLYETDYMEYLHIKEQINYKIMSILKKENVNLAYNTQTIYIKNS